MAQINFLPALAAVPPATRLLSGLLILFSTLGFFVRCVFPSSLPSSAASFPSGLETPLSQFGIFSPAPRQDYPWLFLVPGKVLYNPWTLITAGFAEGNLIEFIVSLISIPLCGRYLERVWSYNELLKFAFVTILASNIISVGFSWIVYFLLNDVKSMYGTSVHGLSCLQVGFLVAFTQLIPEHQVQLFSGLLKLKVKVLPGIYLLVSNVLVLGVASNPYMGIQFGFFAAWVYLRFVKYQEGQGPEGFRGDRSDAFAFHMWFPPFVQKYIAAAGNAIFNLCVKLQLVRPWGDEYAAGGAYSLLPGPGGARAEAERRRALALKALDARLQGGGAAPGGGAGQVGGGGQTTGGQGATQGGVQAELPAVPKPAAQEVSK